jgi:hypothetical protein
VKSPTRIAIAILFTLSIPTLAMARGDGDRPPQRRGSPPQVALDACASAELSAPCSFVGRRGEELTGTCESIQDQLACVPEGHRDRGQEEDRR